MSAKNPTKNPTTKRSLTQEEINAAFAKYNARPLTEEEITEEKRAIEALRAPREEK